MAINKTTKSSALKAVTLYDKDGEMVPRTRTYNNVRPDATDEAVYKTYKHITDLQEDTPEQCIRVKSELLTEN